MENKKQMTQGTTQGSQVGQNEGRNYGNYGGSGNGGYNDRDSGDGRSEAGREQGRQLSQTNQGQLQAAGQNTTTVVPPVDIYEDESCITLIADMPGVSREQLVVRVTGENLVIEGTASAPDVKGEMELIYGETQNPQYRRSFTLSRELDAGKIDAKLADGVLRLTIPRAEEAKPRRINVNVG